MKTIAIANMKGGVGKTTTSIMIADALSAIAGRSVLAIDLDPQANLSWALMSPSRFREMGDATITRWLEKVSGEISETFSSTFEQVGLPLEDNKFADLQLAVADTRMRFREMFFDGPLDSDRMQMLLGAFARAITSASTRFENCVLDCSPALTAMTLAGLSCADSIVVPTPLNPICLASLETFRQRALIDLLNSTAELYVLPTRVGRGGAREQRAIRKELKRREKDGAWKLLDPEISENVDFMRALTPPEVGGFKSLKSKYRTRVDDLKALNRSLESKGIANVREA